MKKFLAILFALWVLLSCAGCQNKPPAEEGVWIIFRKDETHILEWWIGTTGKNWNDASFLTYSTALTADYHLIKNSRDYTRILEILEEFQDA